MKIQHLCKSFDDRVVLDHVSLTLESGGTACLMAPSGRGKTTLAAMHRRIGAARQRPNYGPSGADRLCVSGGPSVRRIFRSGQYPPGHGPGHG